MDVYQKDSERVYVEKVCFCKDDTDIVTIMDFATSPTPVHMQHRAGDDINADAEAIAFPHNNLIADIVNDAALDWSVKRNGSA